MGRSIQEMYDKFKLLLKDDVLFYGVVIVLVALCSFGLGRLSIQTEMPKNMALSGISLASATTTSESNTSPTTDITTATDAASLPYVASKSGTKYHLLSCPGAKQIKDENKIYFATKQDAEKAGYTPAANCNGI